MKTLVTSAVLLCSLACLYPAAHAIDNTATYTAKQMEIRTLTRSLFAVNLFWERIYAVETLTGAIDAAKAEARFQQSQDDINGLFKQYFGEPTGNQISTLLTQYNGLLIDYAVAARNHDDKMAVLTKLHDKSVALATLMSMTNMNWTTEDLSSRFSKYSDALVKEIDLQDTGMGAIDTRAFDATFELSMQLADTVSLGIIKQYPAKFW
jgi:hypothetical protein